MRKPRLLVLALAVAVMLMGAGYAAWTDKITINNTVSTGEMKVQLSEYTWYQLDDITPTSSDNQVSSSTDGYAVATATPWFVAGHNSLDLTLTNMYPGKKGVLNANFENLGTIPAVVKSVDYTDGTAQLTGKNGAAIAKMSPEDRAKIVVTGTFRQVKRVAAGDGNFTVVPSGKSVTINTNLRDFVSVLNNAYDATTNPGLKGWRVEPGEAIQLQNITIDLPTTIINEDNMENKYDKGTIDFQFGQHNN